MDPVKLLAKDFIQHNRPVVECAVKLAAEVERLLASGQNVVVSVHGVRGVSSSFFNVILSAIDRTIPPDQVDVRFKMNLETVTQRLVYQRSLEAWRKQA